MEPITFYFTRNPDEAKKWDLNFKIITIDDIVFYTARLFFRQSKYFQTLFASCWKENLDNLIRLNLSSVTLDKYFRILQKKDKGLVFSPEELASLIELADQHEIKAAVQYLINPIVENEMILAKDFFRLVDTYDLIVNLDANHLIHLEGITDYLNELEEPIIWECFSLAVEEAAYFTLFKIEAPLTLEEYKKIALACYDRFPDKAESFRWHTVKAVTSYEIHLQSYSFKKRLTEIGLFSKEIIFDFRETLVKCFDELIAFQQANNVN